MEQADESDMLRVLPPGPFPPHGAEPGGTIDLGVRLRDSLYRRSVVLDARGALQSSLRLAARSPRHLLMALPTIDAYLDSWPLAAMVDDAAARWRLGPDPDALPVLHRVAEVVGSVLGWPRSVDGHWPLPDEAWMRRQVPGAARVTRRAAMDGAPAVAVALDAGFGPAERIPLPPVLTIHGDQLAARLDEALAALASGQAQAVQVDGWIPWDDASQQAYATLRDASAMQRAYCAFGSAALVAGAGPLFTELLTEAPAGRLGPRLRRSCEAVVVPSLQPDGTIRAVGVLVWDDAFRPVRVSPVAISALDAIGAEGTVRAVAEALQATETDATFVCEQLAEAGAVTVAEA